MTYLITFACYGAHLHGDANGSVDRHHNLVGSRPLDPDVTRVNTERLEMRYAPYILDQPSRQAVLSAIEHHCVHRGWNLLAAQVRSNHVHAVVEAEAKPERIMNEFKSYASRDLNRTGNDPPARKRWARHGSTRWLWNDQDVKRAIQYVIDQQGEPMACFVTDEW